MSRKTQLMVLSKGYGVVVLLTVAGSLMTACEQQTYPDLATGKELYQHHCMRCHQETGHGMFLKGVPVSRLKEIHLKDLKKQITEGSGMMPGFDQMTDEQIDKINRYLKAQIGKKKS